MEWEVGQRAVVTTRSGRRYLATYEYAPGIDFFWSPVEGQASPLREHSALVDHDVSAEEWHEGDPIPEPVTTYPGTDMLLRLCAACGEVIRSLDEIWVDSDEAVVVDEDCKQQLSEEYPFPSSHFRKASEYGIETINDLEMNIG